MRWPECSTGSEAHFLALEIAERLEPEPASVMNTERNLPCLLRAARAGRSCRSERICAWTNVKPPNQTMSTCVDERLDCRRVSLTGMNSTFLTEPLLEVLDHRRDIADLLGRGLFGIVVTFKTACSPAHRGEAGDSNSARNIVLAAMRNGEALIDISNRNGRTGPRMILKLRTPVSVSIVFFLSAASSIVTPQPGRAARRVPPRTLKSLSGHSGSLTVAFRPKTNRLRPSARAGVLA